MLESINHASLEWMPKEVWGPIKWRELHVRALMDFPMDQEAEWFKAYVDGLPCPECRKHFKAFLEKVPPTFTTRDAFFDWTVRAHNHVNQACGKREWETLEARRHHEVKPTAS